MNWKVSGFAIWIICAGLAMMLSSSWPAIGSSDSVLSLSLPRVGLSADQWVGEYHCTLEGFRVIAIRDVPYIWFADVANQKAGRASLDAGHWLGTGPMGKDPIEDLQQIVVLRRSTGGKKHNCPSVNCRLYVQNFHSDDVAFITLKTRQISIRPIENLPSPDPPYERGLKWYVLSVPAFALAGSERIVMFEVTLEGARVVAVRNIPDLWSLDASNNDSASFTGVQAETLADSAALAKNDLGMFDHFVTVEVNAKDAPYFNITVKIKIKTAPRHYRYVRFNTRQVILNPVSYSGKVTD